MTGTRFSLEIQPTIPKRLQRLETLANDLLYSWDRDVRSLFYRLDPALWESCGHNPKVFLRRIAQDKLDAAQEDRVFMQDFNRVLSSYDTYLREDASTNLDEHLNSDSDLVAYFCAEFGFHESFPIYSGGLGILAGDHCKAASDLNVPFVAVGMLYRQGYFRQTIDGNGHQMVHYTPTNFADLPIEPACDAAGEEIHVTIELPKRDVELKVWQARAGHIMLYLLDSDLPSNSDADRAITYQLYGGDINTRIQQEIVLGIGGVRALRALGLKPTVWHINEGHAAFLILERVREYVSQGLEFDSALEVVAAGTVFTTHTPVPAGHDIFEHALIDTYFEKYMKEVKITRERFLELGASAGNEHSFNQTALALHGSRFHNGVSRIHGGVASRMEGYVWPQVPADENPMQYVTNGVHVPTFLAREWSNLFDMRFGGGWRNELLSTEFWEQIDNIPDQTYWSIRQSLKTELLEDAYRRAKRQHMRNGCSATQIERLTQHLGSTQTDILTIGFARRFATYKRATLLFANPDRLARLLNDPERPVVLVFAGKAHPQDHPGQEFIRVIHDFSRRPGFEGKIILLEDYDMSLARKLVSGVDVWLNNPEYPLEASGTSGEKAGINGVINLSVLDGWWGEGYNGENGWAITPHDPSFDAGYRYSEEANELMDILEKQVIPLYYDRRGHGYAEDWIQMSKASMKSIMPRFNSQRMVMDYVSRFYAAASQQCRRFKADKIGRGQELANWKNRVKKAWPKVRIRRLDDATTSLVAGSAMRMEVAAHLASLEAKDVVLECLIGTESDSGKFTLLERHELVAGDVNEIGETVFRIDFKPNLAGLQYYRLRLYPYHPLLSHRFETGNMLWI